MLTEQPAKIHIKLGNTVYLLHISKAYFQACVYNNFINIP